MKALLLDSKIDAKNGWLPGPGDSLNALQKCEEAGCLIHRENVADTGNLDDILGPVAANEFSFVWVNGYSILGASDGESKWLPHEVESRGGKLLGSSSHALSLMLHKEVCQAKLDQAGVPIPKGVFLPNESLGGCNGSMVAEVFDRRGMPLPAVIKPSMGSSSRGVSVVRCREDFISALDSIALQGRREGVLVEEFLSSEDYTCALFQRRKQWLALPCVYSIDGLDPFDDILDSYSRDISWESGLKTIKPLEDARLLAQLYEIVAKVISTLGVRDATRIDFRMDKEGNLRVLDVNGQPGLGYSESVSVALCRAFYPAMTKNEIYVRQLNTVLNSAYKRGGDGVPERVARNNLFEFPQPPHSFLISE